MSGAVARAAGAGRGGEAGRGGGGGARDGAAAGGAAGAAAAAPAGGKSVVELRDFIDRMRGRVDVTGKLLGAIGTTAATTFGIAKLGDVLPAPAGDAWIAVLAVVALIAGIVGVLLVATRLSGVSRPLLMRADLDAMHADDELSEREVALVRPLYERTARLNGTRTLSAYAWRAGSLRRVAERTGDPAERTRREALAGGVESDVELTFGRAALLVVRDRSTRAVTGAGAWVAYLLVAGGLIGFTVAADALVAARDQPARPDLIGIARQCGEARRAGATPGELARTRTADARDAYCDGAAAPAAPAPVAVAERAAAGGRAATGNGGASAPRVNRSGGAAAR